uniref:Menorin-like domain-containing protein n=2 Tax=Anopheles arabiensis TaxID=7173 RepID=A0A182HVE6_ANOAR
LSTASSVADAKANLTKITWAHAVNDAEFLTRVLASDVQFIEADISLGYLKDDVNKEREIPIMAHPPATESDISLETFLQRILQFNREANDPSKVKGVKLDFKSIGAFERSIDIIRASYDMTAFDTWINADILPGPVDNTATVPVDPTRFFTAARRLGKATLSIGWTTRWGPDFSEGLYTESQVDAMIDAIRANGIDKVGNAITFPVRGGIVANSVNNMIRLFCALKDTNNVTFTIWSSADDAVSVEKLREFIFTAGLDRTYVDVPDDLHKKLHLDENAFSNTCKKTLQARKYTNRLSLTSEKMGLPDLPGQPEDDSAFTMDENNTVHLEPLSEDESDNESMDANGYAGYQPLNMDELNHPNRRPSLMEDEAESGVGEGESVGLDGANNSINADFLNVDVWNAPRPNELNIELDSSKAAEIVNVMAGIKLPTTAVPEWARGVPEEEWKENLLQRIRQRQQTDVDDGCSTSFTVGSSCPTIPNSSSSSSSAGAGAGGGSSSTRT